MRIEAGMQARQEMQMKLAPQVIQSIEILQLPLIELEQRIERELEDNPMLEPAGPWHGDGTESQEPAANERSEGDGPELSDVTIDERRQGVQFERLDAITDYYEKHGSGDSGRSAPAGKEGGQKQEALENSPSPDPTLQEHLFSQLSYLPLDGELERACRYIIANLDERGYLSVSLKDIAESAATSGKMTPRSDKNVPGDPLNTAEEALAVVQRLEPPGVGARDLKECLLLQLDPRDEDHELVSEIIRNHFRDITKNKLPAVAAGTGSDLESVKGAVDKIGRLNPRPGALFTTPPAPHVLPDIRIHESDGRYEVILENDWLPSLRLSSYYMKRLQAEDLDEKTRRYLTGKLQAAQGIISAIEQRRATLESVTEEIVSVQKEFFDRGEMYLKPLKMQDIADKVGVHVSTVSRAIANKYAQTPQGIYSLKRFFTGGTRTDNGDLESWDVVKQKLLHIVAGEDRKRPLSDDAIADRLKDQGIDIARRTVSKYRKTLDIPSSRLRRRY